MRVDATSPHSRFAWLIVLTLDALEAVSRNEKPKPKEIRALSRVAENLAARDSVRSALAARGARPHGRSHTPSFLLAISGAELQSVSRQRMAAHAQEGEEELRRIALILSTDSGAKLEGREVDSAHRCCEHLLAIESRIDERSVGSPWLTDLAE